LNGDVRSITADSFTLKGDGAAAGVDAGWGVSEALLAVGGAVLRHAIAPNKASAAVAMIVSFKLLVELFLISRPLRTQSLLQLV